MTALEENILAYEGMEGALAASHAGKWVLIRERELVAAKDSFEAIAVEAVLRFGRGPYLIRQVGGEPYDQPDLMMH